MTLFNEGDDPRTRVEKVEKSNDVDQLVRVACTDDSPRVRLVAVSRIDDDQELIKVVNNAKELDAKLVAIERISSEELIVELVKPRENIELIGMCFSRITDRKLIESIAEDPKCSPVARRMAVEHYADESYLAEAYEARTGRKSERAVEAFVEYHGGGLKGVRAIGRFKRSVKALKALGTIAQKGGETGELAVEYLCNALGSANAKLTGVAADELSVLKDSAMMEVMIRSLEDPKLNKPVREVLARIDTPEAKAALEATKKNN